MRAFNYSTVGRQQPIESQEKPQFPFFDKRFQVTQELGTGGNGQIFLASVVSSGELVAIKTPKIKNKAAFERFRREIENQQMFDHPNILKVKEFVYDERPEKAPFAVLEYCQQGSIGKILRKNKEPFSQRQARDLYKQLLEALKFMHERGFVHRDVKTDNLLLDMNFQLKLADFGSAKKIETNALPRFEPFGTKQFWPPEIHNRSFHIAEEKIDVFASGFVLFSMMTRTDPFKGYAIDLKGHDYHSFTTLATSKFWKRHSDNIRTQLNKSRFFGKTLKSLFEAVFEKCNLKRLTVAQVLEADWINGKALISKDTRQCKAIESELIGQKRVSLTKTSHLEAESKLLLSSNENDLERIALENEGHWRSIEAANSETFFQKKISEMEDPD
jgi:serine/threonine protein kinase